MMATQPQRQLPEQSPPLTGGGQLRQQKSKEERQLQTDQQEVEQQQQQQQQQQEKQQKQELLLHKKRFIINKVSGDVSYYYVNYNYPGLVWRNAIIFAILHLLYACGFYLTVTQTSWPSWLFTYVYAVCGGLGITAGAHRLWSHRSYKAHLSLRIFLMFCNCSAIQNDLIEWCRDHRLHHKSSETDADPHNSNRGWFFAHIGWLLQRKHPKVLEMGNKLDLSDLYKDPVLVFQKRHYWSLALFFGFILPITVAQVFFGEPLYMSILVNIWRYVHSLHCTWFVNSAAHIWGSKDYDEHIEPRESCLVSVGALGEGFHNYHHTFPFDYSTSEHGGYINFTTSFINMMSYLGLAYNLRSVDASMIEKRRARTGNTGPPHMENPILNQRILLYLGESPNPALPIHNLMLLICLPKVCTTR